MNKSRSLLILCVTFLRAKSGRRSRNWRNLYFHRHCCHFLKVLLEMDRGWTWPRKHHCITLIWHWQGLWQVRKTWLVVWLRSTPITSRSRRCQFTNYLANSTNWPRFSSNVWISSRMQLTLIAQKALRSSPETLLAPFKLSKKQLKTFLETSRGMTKSKMPSHYRYLYNIEPF